MQARLGTIVCKFGGDRVMFVVEEAICAKFTDRQTDRQTDGRRTPRDCISSWNELIIIKTFITSILSPNQQRQGTVTVTDLRATDVL